MSVTFEENVVILENLMRNAELGAAAVASAMAQYVAERARFQTLRRRSRAPKQYYRSPRGNPPSYASGSLARGMYHRPVSGRGDRATATAGNTARHAGLLEFGCVLTPKSQPYMRWRDSGGFWRHDYLEVPPHPFLSRTTEDAISDGELVRVAVEAALPFDP